jgi:hypothetical protein
MAIENSTNQLFDTEFLRGCTEDTKEQNPSPLLDEGYKVNGYPIFLETGIVGHDNPQIINASTNLTGLLLEISDGLIK